MANEVDYVPFATGSGANVYSPATYQALAVIGTGVEPGLADPQLANTTWRLASMISAAVANFISNALNIAVLDDGNLANLITNLTNALATGATTSPSRTVTASTNLTLLTTDYAVMFARIAGVAALIATMPTVPIGKKFKLGDLIGNFQADPVTLAFPAGHNCAGLSTILLNVNRKTVEVEYEGNNTWSIEGYF